MYDWRYTLYATTYAPLGLLIATKTGGGAGRFTEHFNSEELHGSKPWAREHAQRRSFPAAVRHIKATKVDCTRLGSTAAVVAAAAESPPSASSAAAGQRRRQSNKGQQGVHGAAKGGRDEHVPMAIAVTGRVRGLSTHGFSGQGPSSTLQPLRGGD